MLKLKSFIKTLLFASSLINFSLAATSTVSIPSGSYTQVAGPGAVQAFVTTLQPVRYCFSTTQPAFSAICHYLDINGSIPLSSMGSGVYLWIKPETNSTTASITLGADATIMNGASGGGGGTSDASAANQVTGNNSLASIDSKTPALVSGRQPVDGSGVTQPVSNAGLTNIDVALSTRLKPADTLAGVTALGSITGALPAGANNIGSVTANLGTLNGAATAANQATEISSLSSIDTKLTSQATAANQATMAANQTNGTQLARITNGTQTADTLASDTGHNSLIVSSARKEVPFVTAGAATSTPFDMSNYRCASVHVISLGGVVSFQGSNNGTDFVPASMIQTSVSNSTTSTSTNSAGILFYNSLPFRFFRLSTAAAANTMMEFSASPCSVHTMGVSAAQSGVWNVGSVVPPTPVVGNSPLSSLSVAYEASRVIKSAAGTLYSIACYNSKASAQWILLFNSASVPADGVVTSAVPIYCAATSNCGSDYGNYGKYFATGMAWSNSSTAPTKTIGSADVFCDARYQ